MVARASLFICNAPLRLQIYFCSFEESVKPNFQSASFVMSKSNIANVNRLSTYGQFQSE